MPICSWMLDVTEQNSWQLYRLEHDNIDYLEFRSMTVRALLKKAEPRKSTGRPKILTSNILSDIRFDKIGHYVVPLGCQMWKCAMDGCKSRPSQGCVKCGIGFCIKCFLPFNDQ